MANPGDKLTFPQLLSDAEIEAGRKPGPDSGPPQYDPWPPLEAGFPRIARRSAGSGASGSSTNTSTGC